ncbi:MAG: PAS domain S-box protein [Bacteroidota bacterium]
MENNSSQQTGHSDAFSDSKAKAHLAAILDHAPEFVYAIDKDFRLTTLNKRLQDAVKESFGLNLQPGDSPLKFFENVSPELVQEWKAIYDKAFAGMPQNFVKEFDINQKSFWDFSINPIRENGKITGLACFVRDVTQQKLSEVKLKESEARFRTVSENPILAIAWGNTSGRLESANQAFCDLMEGSLDQLINSEPAQYTHPDDGEYVASFFRKLLHGEINNYRIEKRYITLKKNIKWVEMDVTAVRDEKGKVIQIVAVVQDISAKKAAEQLLRESETNLRYILDNASTASGLLDKQFNILTANRLANEWALQEMGVTLVEGQNFLEHFPDFYKQMAATVLEKVLEGKSHQYEAKYTKRDKTVSWFHVKIAPIADKDKVIIGICITAEETTLRKKAEEEIRLLNDSLEKTVKERTRELEEANSELEAFTYSVSHDLLSPLRNIDSFIDILVEDYRNVLDSEGQQTISVIKRNSTLMARLINDLLGFARIGKLPLTQQVVNINGVVTEVIDELRYMTNKLAAKVQLKDMHPAYCDPTLIKQVWVNLISNAIKYSKVKENPEIEIGSMEQKGEIVYYIKDNGVGFDLKYADKLFRVFHRLHKSGEFEGTGVGLAIVHRIVTKHGGRIWADAKPNEGAAFYFTLEPEQSS